MRNLPLVFACACLATGLAFAQPTPAPTPDEIFVNGKVMTVDAGFSITEAFAVRGDRFLAVGSNATIKALAGPRTRVTDLAGHAVMPGFVDNHTHLLSAALDRYRGLEMVAVPSLAEMLKRLAQAAAKAKPGDTIVTTGGWNEKDFPEKRAPTRQDLDQVSDSHPIVVFKGRGAAYLNSAALKMAGITRETGTIAGDLPAKDASGEPTGVLAGPAITNAVTQKIVPPPSVPELAEMLRKGQGQLNAWGFTGIREVELPPHAMRAYQQLLHEGTLTLRVEMGLSVTAFQWNEMEQLLKPWGVGTGFGDYRLRLDSVGEFGMDQTGNTFYREPYADRPNERGRMRITADQLRQAMIIVNRYGWRPAVHVMGDATLDAVLDAYEAANAERPIRGRRWIVEHIPNVHPDQMARMEKLGVLVSAQIQPFARGQEETIRRLGRERADAQVPMRELLDHRLIVSTGSDWNGAGENNPFNNIYFYVTRKTRTGEVSGASQKISREEALRVSTINNAYMTFDENEKGSIEPGKAADFLVLSHDIMTVPEDQIPSITPLATYVGGRKVFSGKEAGTSDSLH